MTTYSDVFYRRSLAGNTNITALALNGNVSVPALTVTAGNIYANTSSANIANVLISSTGSVGYISFSSPGAANAPVITFSGEMTGLYKAGNGQVALTSAGVNSAVFATNTNGGSFIYSSLSVTNALTAATMNVFSMNASSMNASNVYVTGNVTVTQIITAANVNATANIYTTGPITSANVNASNVYVTGNATVTQIITAANLNATANIYTTGPITTAGILTAPYVNSANAQHAFGMNAGNIISTGTAILTYLGGNGGQINLDSGGLLFAGGAATFGPLTNFNNGLQVLGTGAAQIIAGQYGTAYAPSYSFTGYTTTGMYCNAANQLSLSAGGTKVATFTSTGATFTNAVTASSNLSVGGDLTVTGNLTISGLTTTVNTTQLTVADPVLVVNSGGLTSLAGMYIQASPANVVVAYNPTSKYIEMFNTSSNSLVNTFTNTGYANVRANTITLDATTNLNAPAINLLGGTNSTGIGGYIAGNSSCITFINNGVATAQIWNPDQATSAENSGMQIYGSMISRDLLVGNIYSTSTVLARTCDAGAFDAVSNTHNISIQGAILKQNATLQGSAIIGNGTGQGGTAFNNIMGTLYVSTTNLFGNATAKAGHATISVLKLAGALEMDVMPVAVHQSVNLNTFTVGKSSDNTNVVISTDPDCAITWQFYGSAF